MKHKSFLLLALLLLVSMSVLMSPAAAQDGGNTYILVHGAFQDASAWSQVIPLLEAGGNTVIAVNSPGRGDDMTPAGEQTLDGYRDAVIEVIEAQDQPVILVGHSFGGMVISAVAEAIPEQIERLVYLAAYLPRDGESTLSISSMEPGAAEAMSQDSGFSFSEDGTMISVPAQAFPFVFCPDCTPEQAEMVAASQIDEPVPPLASPVTLTEANFGSVPKTYILTALDLAVSPTLQVMMLANTPVDQVFALNTGHVPYVSQPQALAGLLEQAAG